MGRKPSKNTTLPPGMRARVRKYGTYYYFDHGGKPRKETPLGSNYVEAVLKWAEMAQPGSPVLVTFRSAADRYLREVVPTKAARTQRDNITELTHLMAFFDNPPAPLDQIEPIHIRQYLDLRGKASKIRANREKALFSHIFNKAREWGYTAKPNPCAGVKGHREKPRDVYVDDAAYAALWQAAKQPLRDAMDLALLTGQRPGDVLSMKETDIRDGQLWVAQAKTGAKLRIAIEGALAELLDRIRDRKRSHNVRSLNLLVNEQGRPLNATTLRSQFDDARTASGQTFQFRDLRAKAGTDQDSKGGIGAAKDLLGHTTEGMTSAYIRHRAGKLVTPKR